MGPSWYWMPDVLSVSLLILEKNYRLLWAYKIVSSLAYYGIDDFITIADNLTEIIAAFEAIEKEAVLCCRILWLEPKVIMILL
jgi:phytoene desaturase